MRHEIRKISKMIDELTTFCLENHADDVQINIKNLDDKEVISVTAYHIKDIKSATAKIRDFLSYPREREMEEYYWELAGEADRGEELGLVGSMIDEARIDYNEEQLYIELIRNK
ncbi:hypothetical protein [Clostridium sp.]|uniref:hypothetical protein n=1 Tax=Clostridium sp. TaxID=1506 RepID=UPI003F2D9588